MELNFVLTKNTQSLLKSPRRLEILSLLDASGPVRFLALRRALGISKQVLSENLRALEAAGLVERSVFVQAIYRVEYALTPTGRGLAPLLHAIASWDRANAQSVPSTLPPADAPPEAHH
jgi:DNA-binding HxlR family transcriptional regulator